MITGIAVAAFRFGLTNAALLALAAAVFALFRHLEQRERRVDVALIVIAAIVLDAALFPTYGSANGVFAPYAFGRTLNAAYVLVPMALLARWLVNRRTATGFGLPQLLLGGWAVWYVTCGVTGYLHDNPSSKITYEGAAVLYVCGTAWLLAGVPWRAWVADGGLPRLARWTAPLAGTIFALDVSGVEIAQDLPGTAVYAFGRMGADAATIFATIGLLAIGTELVRPGRRPMQLLAGSVLLLTPLATTQRAAMLALVVSTVLALAVWLTSGRHRGVHLRPTELLLVLLMLVGLAAVPTFFAAVDGRSAVPDAISNSAETAFSSTAKAQSAESRRNQWREARRLIAEQPVVGHGLGKEYVHFEVGPNAFWEQDITHNVVLDLGLRSGYVGVALFLLAILATVGAGAAVWVRGPPGAAVLASAAIATLAGLLAKGMVESILDKYRTAFLLGVLLGLAYSAATGGSMRDTGDAVDDTPADVDETAAVSARPRVGTTAGLRRPVGVGPTRGIEGSWT